MRRRDFVKGIIGSAAVWPFAARAQQPAMPVVGFLSARSHEDSADLLAALRAGLADTGFAEDRNIRIESRWANDHYDRLPPLARELVAQRVAVLLTSGVAAGLAAKAATSFL
jgi:putative ABC transport system substrate-binding protein